MRTLIKIPIIHTEQDMGSLRDQARQAYLSRYGQEKWIEHLKSIDGIWLGIGQAISLLELPRTSVRLYQDGLPVCGKEADIVRDVAAQGSKNHALLLELMTLGANLMGTEDPALLLQEYHLHQLAGDAMNPVHDQARQAQSQKLLLQRDHFIAQRINSTLQTGEIGLLFLGLAHSVEKLLSPDILVRNLLPSLTEHTGKPA
jgi:hypothetical protein